MSEKEILEVVAKHSPKNFYELKIHREKISLEDLESFFISWTNRIPQKSISLVIIKESGEDNSSLDENEENMEIIKKYTWADV